VLVTSPKIGSLLKLPGKDKGFALSTNYLLYIIVDFPPQFFRKKEDNTYQGTTWQIKFNLDNVTKKGSYKLRVALASATYSELQVTFLNSFCVLD
jgi:hypothetical protein